MLDALYRKSIDIGSEYVFINAWNEWGEGMYLEPDEDSGYSYLEAVKRVSDKYKDIECKERVDGVDDGGIENQIFELKYHADREHYISTNTVKLIDITQAGNAMLRKYIELKGIGSIAIYGIGRIGKILFNQLRKEGVPIQYTVDQYTSQIQDICKMYRPDEIFPNVDLLIVTSFDYEEVSLKLKKKGIENVVSIEKFLDDIISSL